MARLARIVIPDVPHHVTQRGNRRQPVFFDEEDYAAYKELLAEACAKHDVRCLAWCLMPNHVHLILVPGAADALRAALAEAHRLYSRRINFAKGWTGYVWQGRFASYPMDDAHLITAVRYVELNPVKARMVKRAEDWRWSSARAHVLGTADGLTDPDALAGVHRNWRAMLRCGLEAGALAPDVEAAIEAHQRTGRPWAMPRSSSGSRHGPAEGCSGRSRGIWGIKYCVPGIKRDNVTSGGHRLRQSERLEPRAGTDTHGRAGFLIHGDNNRGDQSASEGCIILDRSQRQEIGRSGDNTLNVVSGQPAANSTGATQATPSRGGEHGESSPPPPPPPPPPALGPLFFASRGLLMKNPAKFPRDRCREALRINQFTRVMAALLLLFTTQTAMAAGTRSEEPDCSGPNAWPASMTIAKLKNAGLVTSSSIDFSHVRSIQLSSQRLSRGLYRQVYRVEVPRRTGPPILALTVSDASREECSMGEVSVYLIARRL